MGQIRRIEGRKLATILMCLFIQYRYIRAQDEPRDHTYSSQELAFRYMPPGQMEDKTQHFREEIQKRAESSQARNKLHALLAMSTGGDDTDRNWGSVTIETYPRNAVTDQDDMQAEAKMNSWVAHSQEPYPVARPVVISGQQFAVSVFGVQEGTVTKGAVVWTTIRKGKLLSFAFAANSPEHLKALAESMKSVQFF